jgi:BMFP domain-containing protein YqiC
MILLPGKVNYRQWQILRVGYQYPALNSEINAHNKGKREQDTMINPLENLVKEVLANLPGTSENLRQDVHDSLRAGLELGLKKLDLVTRDEFEAQRAVLDRLREQLTQLEAKIRALETSQG